MGEKRNYSTQFERSVLKASIGRLTDESVISCQYWTSPVLLGFPSLVSLLFQRLNCTSRTRCLFFKSGPEAMLTLSRRISYDILAMLRIPYRLLRWSYVVF